MAVSFHLLVGQVTKQIDNSLGKQRWKRNSNSRKNEMAGRSRATSISTGGVMRALFEIYFSPVALSRRVSDRGTVQASGRAGIET